MAYVIRLTDAAKRHVALLTIDAEEASRPAIDVVFDVIGCEDLPGLVADGLLAEAHVEELKALQAVIFDHDAEGAFIRDGVTFEANGSELSPDDPLLGTFVPVEQEGMQYHRLELVIAAPGMAPVFPPAPAPAPQVAGPVEARSEEEVIGDFALMMLVHMIGRGRSLDVTRDYPFLGAVIEEAERRQYLEIEVSTASYKLTPAGRRQHESWLTEAQELVRKYDIYADVAIDSSGQARFDTGAGEDLRVAVFDLAGVDPFRARFLLGLSDGEWDDLPDWHLRCVESDWYGEIFEPVETAIGPDEVGRDRLIGVVDQAQAVLRKDGINF